VLVGVGVHCRLYLPVVDLFVVGCRVSVVGCRVLTSSRVSLTLVVVLVPGCRLSVDSCWLLIFCAGVVDFLCLLPRSFIIVDAQLCLQLWRTILFYPNKVFVIRFGKY
jgi:hypothetical protein